MASSPASSTFRLDWRPSRVLGIALVMLGLLAAAPILLVWIGWTHGWLWLAIGLFAWRRSTDTSEGYLLAGRNLPPSVAALSAGASDMSGWLLLGLPGALYAGGLVEAWIGIGLFVGAVANSILQGNLIISEDWFTTRFTSEAGYRYFLVDAPTNRIADVPATLTRALRDFGLELTPATRRMAQLNAVHGLFQVCERIYQVRGFDLARQITVFVKTAPGQLVGDKIRYQFTFYRFLLWLISRFNPAV